MDTALATRDVIDTQQPLPEGATRADGAMIQRGEVDIGRTGSLSELVGWMTSTFGGMTVQKALRQAAMLCVADVLAQDMSKAPLQLRQMLTQDTSRVLDPGEHPVAALLAYRPNAHHTWIEHHEMLGLWCALVSNAYAVVKRNVLGDALELVAIQSGQQHLIVYENEAFYDVTASTMFSQMMLGSPFLRVPERDMIHVRARMLDGQEGLATVRVGSNTLDMMEQLDQWRAEIFRDKGAIRGVFQKDTPGILPQMAFERLVKSLRVMMDRYKTGELPVILEDAMKFQEISSNPTEAQLKEQFEAQITQICRLARVPPHKVFQLGGVKYENLETLELSYLGDTLIPFCQRFEQRYAVTLLSPREMIKKRLFFQFDRDALTLRDPKVLTEKVRWGMSVGLLNFDEGRALLFRLPPLPNGQGKHRLIATQTQVVDENGKVVIGGAGIGAPGDGTEVDPAGSSTPAPKKESENAEVR